MAATSRQFCSGDTKQAGSIGGDGNWFAQSNDACPGPDNDSAESGAISDSQSTWMQTTVEGPGTLKFWWKVSSQTGDTMVFVLDGQNQIAQSGQIDWAEQTYVVSGAGTHTFRWRYSKDASGSGGDDCARVDFVQWSPSGGGGGGGGNLLDDAVDSTLTYTTGGATNWFGTISRYFFDGDSAQSGDIDDSEESWMQTTVEGEGTLAFYWKVSSQSNYDWLEFYLDSVRQDRISGSTNWAQKSYTITGSGTHTLQWRYVKGG